MTAPSQTHQVPLLLLVMHSVENSRVEVWTLGLNFDPKLHAQAVVVNSSLILIYI